MQAGAMLVMAILLAAAVCWMAVGNKAQAGVGDIPVAQTTGTSGQKAIAVITPLTGGTNYQALVTGSYGYAVLITSTASPQSAIAANVGAVCVVTTGTGGLWVKTTGTDGTVTTGWVQH